MTTELPREINIQGIIAGIGSPYGEGATYEYDSMGEYSHLDEASREKMKRDLEQLVSSAVQKEREAIEIELDKIYHDLAALQKRFTPGQEEYDRYKNKAGGIRDAISVVLTRMYKDLPKQNPKE